MPGIRPFLTEGGLYFNLIYNYKYTTCADMLFQISLDTGTLIAYKAAVWFYCTVLHGMQVKVLLLLEVFITYVTLVGFLLHMNSFCLVLEVISTCESSAHMSQMWLESPVCVNMCL